MPEFLALKKDTDSNYLQALERCFLRHKSALILPESPEEQTMAELEGADKNRIVHVLSPALVYILRTKRGQLVDWFRGGVCLREAGLRTELLDATLQVLEVFDFSILHLFSPSPPHPCLKSPIPKHGLYGVLRDPGPHTLLSLASCYPFCQVGVSFRRFLMEMLKK